MYYCYLPTPIGDLLLAGDNEALSLIGFPGRQDAPRPRCGLDIQRKTVRSGTSQLQEYFAGKRKTFELPLRLTGTDFQVQVLEELQKIPYGETTSYGAIARASVGPKPCARSVRPTAVTRSRSLSLATA